MFAFLPITPPAFISIFLEFSDNPRTLMAFLRLSNTLRNSHGEQARPNISLSEASAPEDAISDEETVAQPIYQQSVTANRRRASSMIGGGTPLSLAPEINFSTSPPKQN